MKKNEILAVKLMLNEEEIKSWNNQKNAIEKELSSVLDKISSLIEEKRAIEAELKQFTNTVREICAATGKTMDEIEV